VLSEDRFTAQLGVEIGILLEFAAGYALDGIRRFDPFAGGSGTKPFTFGPGELFSLAKVQDGKELQNEEYLEKVSDDDCGRFARRSSHGSAWRSTVGSISAVS
jgi:hypothetical protein